MIMLNPVRPQGVHRLLWQALPSTMPIA